MKTIFQILFSFVLFQAIAQQHELAFYKTDTLSSTVLWKCDKHSGSIKFEQGGFVVDKDSIIGGEFYINMKSIKDLDMNAKQYETAVLILENTLKNEFFEVEKYPYALYKLEQVEHIKDDKYRVIGDFTLHGNKICLAFTATIKIAENQLVFSSEKITIDRTHWGIYRMSPKRPYSDDENGWTVPDEIELHINLKTILDK